jgi:hypothetical protein
MRDAVAVRTAAEGFTATSLTRDAVNLSAFSTTASSDVVAVSGFVVSPVRSSTTASTRDTVTAAVARSADQDQELSSSTSVQSFSTTPSTSDTGALSGFMVSPVSSSTTASTRDTVDLSAVSAANVAAVVPAEGSSSTSSTRDAVAGRVAEEGSSTAASTLETVDLSASSYPDAAVVVPAEGCSTSKNDVLSTLSMHFLHSFH